MPDSIHVGSVHRILVFVFFSSYSAGMTQLLHPDVTAVKPGDIADAAIFGKVNKCAEAVWLSHKYICLISIFNVFVLIRGKLSEDVNN